MAVESQRSELDELIELLGHQIDELAQLETVTIDSHYHGYLSGMRNAMAEIQRIRVRRRSASEDERQKREPDWQAECEAWRRGVGEFLEWMEGRLDMKPKVYLDERRTIYSKFLEFCPQAIIDYNPEITDAEIEHAKKLAQSMGYDHPTRP